MGKRKKEKKLRTRGDKGGEKGKVSVQFSSLNFGLQTTPSCAPSASLTPRTWSLVCGSVLCTRVYSLPWPLWHSEHNFPAHSSASYWPLHLHLSLWLGHTRTPASCLGWVRKPEGTDADTSLLFWLLLTRVNCYHKAWRMAPYVSVLMWACLALRNMERSVSFWQNDQRFSPNNLL